MKKKITYITAICFLAIFVFLFFRNLGKSPENENVVQNTTYPAHIQILKGDGIKEIVDELYSKNVIRSKVFFKFYSIVSASAGKFKSGFYEIALPLTAPELMNLLVAGPKEVSVVISPGMALKEIDQKLAEFHVINKNDLIDFRDYKDRLKKITGQDVDSMEGFLFPDTYRFYQGSGVDAAVNKILDNFENKALTYFKEGDNILNILTIASFLEKEIPEYGDRQIVAAILKKRLSIGMPLQIDATIIYVKCGGAYLNCPPLDLKDYKINSPFNTYLNTGLTPTPVSNPSLDAIKAAIDYKDKGYLYYLSDPKTKKTIFSKNLDEHNYWRAIYLKK